MSNAQKRTRSEVDYVYSKGDNQTPLLGCLPGQGDLLGLLFHHNSLLPQMLPETQLQVKPQVG